MGFFDKKYCDICGDKIGLLGNRKLEDGNLCKNCAKKLSPWFDERRHSTVEQIKRQLAYREENKKAAAAFRSTRSFGKGSQKLYVDENARKFTVNRGTDFGGDNADILDFSQATGCDLRIDEHRREMHQTVDGKSVSYHPPRYEYSYDFKVTVRVDHPYFSDMDFNLKGSSVDTGERCMSGANTGAWTVNSAFSGIFGQNGVNEYNELVQMGNELKAMIDSWRSGGFAAAAAPAMNPLPSVNTNAASKEIRFGSTSPVPYQDNSFGNYPLSLGVNFYGVAKVSVASPVFMQNCGSFEAVENQLQTVLAAQTGQTVYRCSNEGIPFAKLPAEKVRVADTVKSMLAGEWMQRYGLHLEAVHIQGFSLTKECEDVYHQMEKAAAMQSFGQQAAPAVPNGVSWTCGYCGAQNTGKFCTSCGAKKE